jgi:hypothetical protein
MVDGHLPDHMHRLFQIGQGGLILLELRINNMGDNDQNCIEY